MSGRRLLKAAALEGLAAMFILIPFGFLHATEVKESRESMIRIPSASLRVGSTAEERAQLGRQYDFHPSWLGDELPAQEVTLKEFWIDRFPVTNRQYAAYLRATGHPVPPGWDPALLDHPVVNISGQQAAAYAGWAGKRLPSAQEWECAFRGIVAKPAPIQPSWDWITQTRPVAAGPVAPSGAAGYGLVSEITAAMRSGEKDFLAKGPSWVHEEAWSFRPQASHYAAGGYPYIGFRCAADSYVLDRPELLEPLPEEWLTPVASQPAPTYDESYASFSSPTGRYLLVQFGNPRGICYLFCPEIVSVGDKWETSYNTSPTIIWEEGENKKKSRRAVYTVQGDYIRTKYILETGPDFVDIQSVLPNEADEAQQMWVSICVSPGSTFNLYDIEEARTYFWFGKGDWIRARQFPHTDGRTLTYHAPPTIPEAPSIVAAAVVSRDGSSVFGYAREILGRNYMAHDHANICCFHIEPIVQVPAGDMRTVRGRVYYMKGDLEALRRRIIADFPR